MICCGYRSGDCALGLYECTRCIGMRLRLEVGAARMVQRFRIMDQRVIANSTAEGHRSRVTRFMFVMLQYQCTSEVFPPTLTGLHVFTMHRLEVDPVQPSTVLHDLGALRCALHQVKFLPLGWDIKGLMQLCRMSFAHRGAVRMYAKPAKRQRPIETEEVRKLAEHVEAFPSEENELFLLSWLLNYFCIARRGAVQWLQFECVPGKVELTDRSAVQVGRWSRGLCLHFIIDKDKNLTPGTLRRLTLPDRIPMLPNLSTVSLLERILFRRTRDRGCLMGCNQRVLKDPSNPTFSDSEWSRAAETLRQVLGDRSIATTAFRRGYVWALYRHNVSRDKLADIGFWSADSKAMDVYHGVSSQERCEHITSLTVYDVVQL